MKILQQSSVITWIGGAKRRKAKFKSAQEWESHKAELINIIKSRINWTQATAEVHDIGLRDVT